jgi:hypothetical protein
MDVDLSFDFDLKDLELDFDLSDFNIENESDGLKTRISPPKVYKKTLTQKIKYANAEKLAKEIDISKDTRSFVIVSGNFIFGDFLETLIFDRKLNVKNIYISTLSISENNIDSLRNIQIISHKSLNQMNIILSDYFFSHEKWNLVKYLYQELDKDNKLQVAYCGNHCKISMIETHDGLFYIMHGSANLRSSGNIEQFVFEENEELYKFNKSYMDAIIKKYKTINKSIRGNKLDKIIEIGD